MADACGHNFCQNCLLANIGGPYRSLLAEIGGGNEWLCPECRSEQSKKPDELMRNRLVEKAVESLNDNLSFNATVTQNEVRNLCPRHNLELTLCKFCINYMQFVYRICELTLIGILENSSKVFFPKFYFSRPDF